MNDLRTAAQQALAFTMRDFASLRDFEAAKAVLHDNLRAALAQQDEPVEPVAWSGYDLDGMVEAFSRVIEAHHSSKHPFHNPIDMDARMALRILRGFIPAMKAHAAPPQRKPLTNEEIDRIRADCVLTPHEYRDRAYGWALHFARAVERAPGITDPQVADRLARHGIPKP